MDNENKKINSIAELFKQRNITIPVIQRDYAQGRDEDSAKSIREDFINSLFEAVNDDKEMDINYIYGISKSGGNFLPIDGQQRITSIFLFLWFCAVKEEKTELFCKYMKKFSYMVRVSAEEFFDILQERSDGRDPALKYKDDFKEYADRTGVRSIRDFNWYKLEWDNDTTIDGAIRFLECVREKYNKEDPNRSFTEKLLGDDCPIKLIFIEQSNTSDEKDSSKSERLDFEAENRAAITYINMNERGKLLNDFENLKAYLCRLDNTDKDAQSFLTKYDSDYINNFMKLGGNTGSLSYQVKKADETAFNFLSHVYCDLKGIPNKPKWPIYTFMGMLNAEQKEGKKVFPDDYFEFMHSVIETLDANNKKWMIEYCDQYNEPNRYRFYLFFWAVYKKLSEDAYWEKLKEHMKLTDEKLYVNKKFPYIKNLIDILSSGSSQKGGLLNYLAEIDPDDIRIRLSVTTDNLTYGDKTSWKEEQIKARCLLKCSKDLSYNIERVGSKFNHQIRFLLYMSGLWNGNITQDGLEALDKYIGIANVLVFNTFEWKKIFYLSSLDGNDPPSLPKPQETTVWNDKYLYWSDENVLNEKLINRIKWCFDKIFETSKENDENDVDYKEALKKYVEAEKARLDKNIWLYYVLDRNYKELFDNMVKIKDGVYTYNDGFNGCQNFYEFVMQKDLEEFKKLELLPYAVISKNSDHSLGTVKKDGSNAKNGLAVISFYNKFKDHSFRYFKDDKILYRYKYKECKKTEADCNEDFFELESNSSAIEGFEAEYENCFNDVKDVISKILKDDKDTILRKWMFDRDIKDLKTALEDHPTLKDYSLECERKGQSKIYITLTKEVGYSSEKNEEPAHSAFFEKFKEVSAN